jgi:hypothetical protein
MYAGEAVGGRRMFWCENLWLIMPSQKLIKKAIPIASMFFFPPSWSRVHTSNHNLVLISSQHNGRPGGPKGEEEEDNDTSKTKQTWDELRVATRLV